jgi:branched-chain amino acid transport system permease protein
VGNFAQQVVSGLASGGIYALLALAIVLIHRSTGVINFAQGEMATLSAFVCFSLTEHGWAFWPAFAVTILLSFAGGAALQVVVIRPIQGGPLLGVVILTIGLLIAINGLDTWIWGGAAQQFNGPFSSAPIRVAGVAFSKQDMGVVGIAIAAVLVVGFLFARTKLGLGLRAAAVNPLEARGGARGRGGRDGCAVIAPRPEHDADGAAVRLRGGGARRHGLAARRRRRRPLARGRAEPARHVRALGRRRAAPRGRARTDPRGAPRAACRTVRPRCGESRMTRPRLLLAAAAVLVVLPFLLSDFRTGQLATVGAYFIAILGLDVLTGHSGQISLGHGAFMALGSYITGILVIHHGVRDVATIPLAAGIVGGVGLLAGIPALRLSGLYLALATFGIAVVFPTLLNRFDGLTGGSAGLSFFGNAHETGHGLGVTVLDVHLSNAQWLYALTWLIGGALFLFAWYLLASRFGRSLRAVRDSELAAAASGVNRSFAKVAAFGLSAAYAGVAGSLFAINLAYVSPQTIPVQLSLYLLVGAVVGFFGSIWGALLGALVIEFLGDVVGVIPHVDTTKAGPTTFAFGAILVVLMLVLPLVQRVVRRL